MKTIYKALLLIAFIPSTTNIVSAQCEGGRYISQIFSADNVTSNIQFGSNITYTGASQNLQLDVYQPTGDTAAVRPLIIIAHGGSFIFGSKTGTDVVPFCHDFAKMGYVVASINYRLGITGIPIGTPDSVGATESVIRGVHDGKAAVRFFRKSAAASGNPYKIDVNQIYFAGVSAGAIIALHIAYLDEMSEYPSWVDSSHFGLSGGLEGNSGNPGYSSEVNAIINICGAIRDTAWIHPGDEPVCSFHGTNDQTVPYGSAIIYLLGTYPMLQVDGSFSIAARVNQLGIENCFETYEGQDHVPHVSSPQYYDTTKVIMRNFLAHYVCGYALACNYSYDVGIEKISKAGDDVLIYPNPANNHFGVRSSEVGVDEIEIYDMFGKIIFNQKLITYNQSQTFDISDLPSGIYMVKIFSGNRESYTKLVKE
jgi:para-nitrobenzyl esterase